MVGYVGNRARSALPEARRKLSRVVWSAPALGHLEAIRLYLESFNPKAAREVAASLKALGDGLAHFPYRGRLVPGTDKRELVSTYPYIVRYVIDGETVVILRVRHTSRRPI